MRVWMLVGVIAIAAILIGCERRTNVSRGQTDYPIENTQLSRTLKLTMLIPKTLNIQASAVYVATYGRGELTKPTMCHFVSRTGTETEYSIKQTEFFVVVPLILKYQQDEPDTPAHSRDLRRFYADIQLDKFKPGRCLWKLDRVEYSTGDSMTPNQQLFRIDEHKGFDDETAHQFPGLRKFWCVARVATREIRAHHVCSGPLRSVSQEKLSSKKKLSLLTENEILFGQDRIQKLAMSFKATKLLLEFYDIDNLVPEPEPEPESESEWEHAPHIYKLTPR
jgi:hypothetical protein